MEVVIQLLLKIKLLVTLTMAVVLSFSSFVSAETNEPIPPLPLSIKFDQEKLSIGKLLFHDKHLSLNKDVSCASCHKSTHGLADDTAFSTNSKGKLRTRNSQALMNSVFFSFLHWDGEFSDLTDLSLNGMEEAVSNDWLSILTYIKSNARYKKAFNKSYEGNISRESVSDALTEYLKSFIAPDSRFDQFLRGQHSAMTEREVRGYFLFKSYGCISCHNGVVLGAQMFAKLGQFGNYFQDRGNIKKQDYGRFNITGNESDRFRFRVPSLRNVALTAPYFHDGSQKTLDQAVQSMAKYQLGRELVGQEVDLIVEFLKTLTGDYKSIGKRH